MDQIRSDLSRDRSGGALLLLLDVLVSYVLSNVCVQVCLDNRCVDVSAYGLREECERKCNNNGVKDLLEGSTLCFSSVTQLIPDDLFLFELGVQPQTRVPLQPRLGSALLRHPVRRFTPR